MIRVPFFDLKRLYDSQRSEIDSAVRLALESGHYILGKNLERFENELCADLVRSGEGRVLGCNSGTDALVLALRASGVGAGDEVITPSHTAIPTITAIVATGAKPVFVDIDRQSWLVDSNLISEALTTRTKAVLLVHLYGNMVNVPEVLEILKKKKRDDVAVIEDVAQAHASTLGGRQAGTLARLGAFSFYPTKNIGALGDGGAVFAKTTEDANNVSWLRNYGQRDRYNAEVAGGVNSRLDEIQAAVLLVRLKKLKEWNLRKTQLVENYRRAFSKTPLSLQAVTKDCVPAWHLFVVAAENQKARDHLMQSLESQGVQSLVHYPIPTHTQKAFSAFAGAVKLPVTEDLATRIVSLPMNPVLSDAEQELVVQAVLKSF